MDKKIVAAAVKRLEQLKRDSCIDPYKLDSKPSPKQQAILEDGKSLHVYCIAGNQCLAEGTEVLTTAGVKRIEDIEVGDKVYDEYGNPILVKAVFANGEKEVVSLTDCEQVLVEATEEHRFFAIDIREKNPIPKSIPVSSFQEYTRIKCKSSWVKLEKSDKRLVNTYDIHVDSPTNLYCLANGLVTHNSGKTAIGGRIIAWKFLENHPYWERPNSTYCNICKSTDFKMEKGKDDQEGIIYRCSECDHIWVDWGDEPLLLIVAGRLSPQNEEIWNKKIKPFLPPGCFKVARQAGAIQSVTHKVNGNKILFTSHDKSQVSWEKIQSYVAHHFWLDEMPGHDKYIEEAHRRVDAKLGQFIATFTPKSKNEKTRHRIDTLDPAVGKVYRMGKFDNPIYWGREDIELAKLSNETEERRNCILYGDWMGGDDRVFEFAKTEHVFKLTKTYTKKWEHVLSYDPATNNIGGLIIAACDPKFGTWWIVKSIYIKGKAPSDLVEEIRRIAKPYNIVRKVYDVHESWFYNEAIKQKYTNWMAVDKHSRKNELITNVQQALLDKTLLFAVNLDNPICGEFIQAEWLPGTDKIRRATKYHLIDATTYFWDVRPKLAPEQVKLTRDEAIKEAHFRTMENERLARQALEEFKRTGRKRFYVNRSNRWNRIW